MDRTIYPSQSGEPTGREMPLHFRSGGYRTYRAARYVNMQGKRGPFKPTIVRRDKEGEIKTPHIYDVVGRQKND